MIVKSTGVTETERMLANFCERSFLKLWCYPNPIKDDGHELCDLLAVFEKHIFIFFDREMQLPQTSDKDPNVLWKRWKRNVIDRQIGTAHGAERYIASGRSIFLDALRTIPFPIGLDLDEAVFHKIIVAHGAEESCINASERNVYGSLAICYTDNIDESDEPFYIEIDRQNPVHIFDSHNLPILLKELDTVTDFSNFLVEKIRAIGQYDTLSYCGEEDLLAHYFLNFNSEDQCYRIGTKQADINWMMIGEGEWFDFVASTTYKNTVQENAVSYFWDELIQRTCQNALDGKLGGNSNIFQGQSAIFEMVKEPRFMRRALSQKIRDAVVNFPDHQNQLTRQVTLVRSFFKDVAYIFFQLRVPEALRAMPDYLDKRRSLLETACGAAKNKFTNLTKIIGIGMDAPKFAGNTNSEDFILLSCDDWPDEERVHYEEQNKEWNFFGTKNLRSATHTVTQFVPLKPDIAAKLATSAKIGRNDLCPCGSMKKFKRCHGA